MKLVAVSQRVDVYPDRNERRDALDQRLCQWLVAAGYVPVPVPNRLGDQLLNLWLETVAPQAVLLSGGNDIGSILERDATERNLLQYAASQFLPVLGICRGMQLLGVYGGADLVKVSGHAGTQHAVQGSITRSVNSYHNYALGACPVDYDVQARAQDGVIEAIRHKKLPWEGWMWHPEREELFSRESLQRFINLVESR